MEFVAKGDIDYFKRKVSDGWDINEVGEISGNTALLKAMIEDEQDDLVRWLVQNGADVNVGTSDGRRPLHLARTGSIAELLLCHGADVTLQDNDGWSALHYAVNNARKDVVRALMRRGANQAAVTDNKGRTAVDLATEWLQSENKWIQEMYQEIIRILKEHEQWTVEEAEQTRTSQALAVVIGCNWQTLESSLPATKHDPSPKNDELISNLKNEVDKLRELNTLDQMITNLNFDNGSAIDTRNLSATQKVQPTEFQMYYIIICF